MKRYIFLLFILLCTLGMKAQYVRVVAPKHVSVGEEFQVEYTVYTQDVRRFQRKDRETEYQSPSNCRYYASYECGSN